MTTTPNLAITHVAASQAQKEVTLNDALTALDTALCDQLAVDFAGGNVTLSSPQYRGYCAFRATNLSVARDLTLPAVKRLVFVNNADGAAVLTVKRGATVVEVPDGEGRLLYTDGTTDGLFEAGGGSGSGIVGATTYLLAGSLQARPAASQRVFHHLAGSGFALLTGLPGAVAAAKTAATQQADFAIRINGASKGTIRWPAAATSATFIWAADVDAVAGDEIEIIAPGAIDATLADITWTIEGAIGNPGTVNLADFWEAELPIQPATVIRDLLGAVDAAEARSAIAAAPDVMPGFKNRLINGDFRINQRGFAGGALSAGVYGFDRWKASVGGASMSVSGPTVTLASGGIEQVIEALRLAGLTVVVSAEVMSGTLRASVDGSAFAALTGSVARKSVSFVIDGGSTGDITLKLDGNGAPVAFREVQLEEGAVATPFEKRPDAIEWLLCRRYRHQSYSPGVAPGTADATGAIFMAAHATCQFMGFGRVPLAMRAAPTITLYNPVTGSTTNPVYNYWASASVPATVASPGATGFSIHVDNTSVSQNQVLGVHFVADAEL